MTTRMGVKGLAVYLKLGQNTVRRMLRRGEAPPFYVLGQRHYWQEEDVVTWLESRKRSGFR